MVEDESIESLLVLSIEALQSYRHLRGLLHLRDGFNDLELHAMMTRIGMYFT